MQQNIQHSQEIHSIQHIQNAQGTPVCLVGRDGILKEGMKSLLAKTDFNVVGDYDDMAGLSLDLGGEDSRQIILCIDEGGGDSPEAIRILKKRYTRSRVVIMRACAEMPAVMAAFAAGVDGYILKDISCEGLVGYLRLIEAGEKVCPTSVLSLLESHIIPANAPDISVSRATNDDRLSDREKEILHRLAIGDPNKVIASNFGIAEATVKVHVKTILRKLGVANRTQAAIWAIAHGYVDDGKPGVQLRLQLQA